MRNLVGRLRRRAARARAALRSSERRTASGADAALAAERAIAGPRTRTSWDEGRDEEFVAQWASAPGPSVDGPWVTVVMPVRDRAEQVARAIASVQHQTLSDWRLVVVDDGSSDATPDVVAAMAAEDPRIALVRREHQGVCAARNAGIAAATTPYVAFLDSDNAWTPAFLRTAVAALHAEDGVVGHAVVDEVSDQGHRYRAFDGQAEHLRTGNFVDLNVLVARTDAVRQVGGFDPSLRRMVDYDLVWKLAERHRLHLLPFVGVRYAATSALSDRISATESFAWDDVVKARHLVDLQQLGDSLGARHDNLLSVLVPHRGAAQTVLDTVDRLRDSLDVIHEVVVVDLASPADEWRRLYDALTGQPDVQLLRTPGPLDRAAGVWIGLASSRGDRVVTVPSGAALEGTTCRVLVDALGAADIVWAAGDLESGVVAARAAAFVSLHGLDPLLTDEWEVADLVRRAQQAGLRTVATEAPIGIEVPWPSPSESRHADNVREWERRWPGVVPGSTP